MEIKKYKTRFSLISSGKNSEEKQLFLVVTIKGVEVFYYSGYRVDPKNFIKKSKDNTIEQIKKNTFNKDKDSASSINARIRELENAALIVFEQNFKGRDIDFSKEDFKKYLQIQLNEYSGPVDSEDKEEHTLNIFDALTKYKNEYQFSSNRRRHYSSDIKRLKEYEKLKSTPLSFENLDVLDYKKYITKGRAFNTVISMMKRLRAFFNYCESENIIADNPFKRINFASKVGSEIYNEPICMTREELTQLYNAEMPDYHNERVRDMFCLQAALGCRVSDFIRLTYDNVQNGHLTYFPEKSKGQMQKVIVPLSQRAKYIIDKYKKKKDNNLLMPFINAVEYNKTLKDVFKTAKLNRKIVQFDKDLGKETYSILCDIVTSHLARRTFVDILCQAGEPIHVVASMSGHSETSKAFDRYRRRPEQLQRNAVKRSMD